ncbi:MAG TPA: polysaccharide deacetylase family protein [Verrucomicrobiae bacterium]
MNIAATLLMALARRFKKGGVIVNEHTLTNAQTELHLQVLGRWFDFIALDELPQRMARPGRRPFCLLTFDDGKRSNFSQTAPVLERLRVPAVFYLTTGPVTTGSAFWFDQRERIVKALGCCPSGLELAALKKLPFDQLMERLERVGAKCDLQTEGEPDDLRPMSWDEARSLNQRGFAVGAHGVTHAILTRENRQKAFGEIEESLGKVSLELGSRCRTFAFPNGNWDRELAQHAERCGARTIMTTEPTWVDHTAALWHLPRVQIFGGSSRARIESKIALAAVRGALANPDGTGRRYREGRTAGGTLSPGVPVPGTSR